MARIVTITSGKGGVGKTTISVNTALCLASRGIRTCLFDADLGLANVTILLGLTPEHTLKDVVEGSMSLREIMIRDVHGVDIVPGSSGVEEIADLGEDGLKGLMRELSSLSEYEVLIFDTSAGISRSVVSFCRASEEIVLVVSPEPTSLTDAYALLKVLSLNDFRGRVGVVVNLCRDPRIAGRIYARLRSVVERHLAMELYPLGAVLFDPKAVEAVHAQRPLVLIHPETDASRCMVRISQRLWETIREGRGRKDLDSFWQDWVALMQGGVRILKGSRGPIRRDSAVAREPRGFPVGKESRTEGCVLDGHPGSPSRQERGGGASSMDQWARILADSISSVTEEIRGLREDLRKVYLNHSDGHGLWGRKKGNLVRLDYEAFVRRRGRGGIMEREDESAASR